MKKYTATELDLIKLGKRERCKAYGHDPVRHDSWVTNGERDYTCDDCDARFKITYPPLDYQVSDEQEATK